MANQEHLNLLRQGAKTWNQWRQKYAEVQPDLSSATLDNADLSDYDLHGANLRKASLIHANLYEAYLSYAIFDESNLNGAFAYVADLVGASFFKTNLLFVAFNGANLSRANLRGAYLGSASFMGANLNHADLSHAHLNGTDFRTASLKGTIFEQASARWTIWGAVDLSLAKGLATIKHYGPSTISIDTIYQSHGKISEKFLRGTGVPEPFILYAQSLIAEHIKFHSCFISYSTKDQLFVEQLYLDLQCNGVRCWFAPEDLKWGDKIRSRIDESIHLYEKLLLILSEHSVCSQWVEQEVETALAKERKRGHIVLFPIRLDNAVMNIGDGWPTLIRNTRNIGDFTCWKQCDTYKKSLDRLLRDLKTEV
ncbi:hypothetical protein KSF_048360 [Reticulibacter mediterranei]|uniref:TIR domain-containing protein n=1 Tax=Reticulibacter mediterranei TaxID=2778369 RepID=A0A8J3IJE9_9CHLR|nr:toll/interleukin-1 receptor domain-containing protein [Reticulibacter mediterranei]GHO94788.1 hypothetical protein KSF_048360 [Reticulibacter mediterranei]